MPLTPQTKMFLWISIYISCVWDRGNWWSYNIDPSTSVYCTSELNVYFIFTTRNFCTI